MYALIQKRGTREKLVREVLTFGIAELYYHFHSFSVECLAFLATWSLLSGLADLAGRLFIRVGGPDGRT